jgi:hypothetical protein
MNSELRKSERLYQLMALDDCEQTVYVYRIDPTGRMIKPYVAKWGMHSSLLDSVRDDFGTGVYYLMIRHGKTMVFTGTIGVECPRNR